MDTVDLFFGKTLFCFAKHNCHIDSVHIADPEQVRLSALRVEAAEFLEG